MKENFSTTFDGVNASNCEREQIHFAGSIQAHGVLVVLRPNSWTIAHLSANAAEFFGVPLEDCIGLPLLDFASVQAPDLEKLPSPFTVSRAGRRWEVSLHARSGRVIAELEPLDGSHFYEISADGAIRSTHSILERFEASQTTVDLCERAVETVRQITGYDRVMLYRFDADWHGEVIAESRVEGAQSYQGHHFPASDIPPQARAIFLENWLRMIPDVNYTPIPILPLPETPIDLGRSSLRSVSPIHVQYLKNMDVQATMTVSILHEGKLWGLIAAHHITPRRVGPESRRLCEMVGRLCSTLLRVRIMQEEDALRSHLRTVHARLVHAMSEASELSEGLTESPETILEIAAAEGAAAAIHLEGEWTLIGNTPSIAQIHQITDWLHEHHRDRPIFGTSSLPTLFPAAEAWKDTGCGVLAISIPKTSNSFILWFRPERLRTVNWAGNPKKEIERLPDGTFRIDPRKSFESWRETVRLNAVPWKKAEWEAALELRTSIIALDLRRQFQRERMARAMAEKLSREKEVLLATVSHDLKNPLAAIDLLLSVLDRRMEKREVSPDEIRKIHGRVRHSTERMAGLIHDLLDIAKIEGGAFQLAKKSQRLDTLLQETVDQLQPLAQEKGIALTAQPCSDTCEAAIDEGRILQVVSNLVGNAIKFTPNGGAILLGIDREADEYVISVADTGYGIPAEDVPRVFDRFWQAEKAGRSGTGLGLAIARGIVEAHGGRIWVESVVGQGTRVLFTVPVH